MRNKHRIITLLTAFVMMLFMTVSVSAEQYTDTGTCTFDGSSLNASFKDGDLVDSLSILEPGDSLEYTITYKNESNETTYWYLANEVLQTLEDGKDAATNGGYTYVLQDISSNGKTETYFDNSEVGGETVVANLEGLKQATNATSEYFFIKKLAAGDWGQTYLKVVFDGETQANAYNDTLGRLKISYAVEKVLPNKVEKEKDKVIYENSPRTGDAFDMMKYILLMTAALILAIIAFILRRRDKRRDGVA